MKSLKESIQESLIIEAKELTIEVTLENGSTKKDAEKYASQYGLTLINFTDDKNFGQIAMYTGTSSKLSNFTKEVFSGDIENYIIESSNVNENSNFINKYVSDKKFKQAFRSMIRQMIEQHPEIQKLKDKYLSDMTKLLEKNYDSLSIGTTEILPNDFEFVAKKI